MEEWKVVHGFDGYEASNTGKVRDCKTGKVLNQSTNAYGYKTVGIRVSKGVWRTQMVHRLVATAFIRPPQKGEQVNHKDGKKDNNHIDNLEWVTAAENIQHSFDVLGKTINNKKLIGRREKGVRTNLKLLRISEHLTQEEMGAKMGVSRQVYSNIERGHTDASGEFWDKLQTVFGLSDAEAWRVQQMDKGA